MKATKQTNSGHSQYRIWWANPNTTESPPEWIFDRIAKAIMMAEHSSVCSTMSRMAAAMEIQFQNFNFENCLFDFFFFNFEGL